jgi:NADH-quinone oxidoreductase subunit A
MIESYLPILIFLVLAFVLACVLISIPFLVSNRKRDNEKLSAYECGFEAFEDARIPFDVRFYLVSILFIIFDLEIALLFPWAIVLKEIGLWGFFSMIFFLFILTIGFIYEWRKGALEWK